MLGAFQEYNKKMILLIQESSSRGVGVHKLPSWEVWEKERKQWEKLPIVAQYAVFLRKRREENKS